MAGNLSSKINFTPVTMNKTTPKYKYNIKDINKTYILKKIQCLPICVLCEC